MAVISKKQQLAFGSLVFLISAVITGVWHAMTTETVSPEVGATDGRGYEVAQVQRVIDGDTIELTDGRKVRYIGIDTPETNHPSKGVECFGHEAGQRNRGLVLGQVVQLEKDVSDTDRFGRLLRYVWKDEVLVNQQLVAEGMAFASSFPPDVKRQDQFRAAEQQAQIQGLGLWSSCDLPELDELNATLDQADEQVLGAADAEQTTECVIKGNISSNGWLYHLPECSSYDSVKIDQAKGEQWFCSEAEAEKAGWTKAGTCS